MKKKYKFTTTHRKNLSEAHKGQIPVNKLDLSKTLLIRGYMIEKKSTVQLAKYFNCCRTTVRRYMGYYGIPRRNISKATKLGMTEKVKGKLRKSLKGQHHSPKTEFKKGQKSLTKGRKFASHHVYLKENSSKKIKLPFKKHIKLHYQAYKYIYERYGKKAINEYLNWFDKKYGLK